MAEKWYAVFVNGSHEITMKTQHKAAIRGAHASKDGDVQIKDAFIYTAAEHEEVERLRLGHERYEKLRRLNVPQFQDLYQRNIKGEGAFDSLVDALPRRSEA